jgi:uncharacterized protein YjdB
LLSTRLISTTTSLTSSPNPSAYGQSVTLTATVSPSSGTGTPTGSVTFMDGTTSLGSAPLSGGKASLPVSSLTAGSHSITTSYGGDTNYTGSTSSTLTQSVNKANTTTALASSSDPSRNGQTVTFTANVSPAGATGTVQFFDGTISLGTSLLTAGKATLAISSLSAGQHPITAKYLGDANYNSSTSAVLTQTVRKK